MILALSPLRPLRSHGIFRDHMHHQFERLKADLSGRYDIERPIGRGGMATVYLAHDRKHDRPVALKVLNPDVAATLAVDRFLQEIRIAARLNHPHILPLYDSGEVHDLLYYVMPLGGESLRLRLTREVQLPVDEAMQIAREVLDALDYAHGEGVVHRDIKPENILLSHGHATVADFGIARAASAAGGPRLTQVGLPIGTPAYMSPEQIAGDPRIDGRSDLYSFACVLHEMLTGTEPVRGPAGALDKGADHDAMSDGVAQAISKALLPAASDRFATGAEFAEALGTTTGRLTPHASAQPARAERAIAVLPFANMSPDPENEYFSDGITEEIINALTRLAGLRVAARTSSFAFKGTTRDISDVGAKLNVTTVLEGSVRKAGSRLRITAQLVNVADGFHLWSERYDREIDDVFAVQDEIATKIADRLKITLTGATDAPLVKPATENLEAYQRYLKGRYMWNKHTFESYHLAIRSFEQAIELDPSYARAHAGIAASYFWLGFLESMPPGEAYPKVKASASRALEIDDSIAEAHTYLGSALMTHEWDWDAAEVEFQRGIALDPKSVVARQGYAVYLANLGRTEEALDQTNAALAIDSLWVKGYQDLGFILTLEGKYAEALDQLGKALELDPNFPVTHVCRGYALVHSGRFAEAIAAFTKSVEAAGGGPFFKASLAFALGFSGQREEAQSILDQLVAQREHSYVQAALIAWIHIGMGEYDAAFDWLERAFEERSALLISLPSFNFWDPIRGDERFAQLLEKMGLAARGRLPARELLLPVFGPRAEKG